MDQIDKHTPVPWVNPNGSVTVKGPDGGKIADMSGASYDVPMQEANAAFIVLACNNHDSLLAALDATRGIVAWAKDHGADRAATEAIEKMTRKAIRKAKAA
jgi:hypothetical protein